jgi:hypothetical protein
VITKLFALSKFYMLQMNWDVLQTNTEWRFLSMDKIY